MPKPSVKNWRELPTENWTTTTFREYLKDTHAERYGIDYVTRSYAVEGRWLKSMIAEHGAEVVRAFIDECFREYRPTRDYPGLNFAFAFTYMRARVLPRVLARGKAEERAATNNNEFTEEWF